MKVLKKRSVKIIIAVLVIVIVGSAVGYFFYDRHYYVAELGEYPLWVRKMIIEDHPTALSVCSYKEKPVYFFRSACCDNYDYMYEESGDLICAPTGGFSGWGTCGWESTSRDAWFKTCSQVWTDPETAAAIERQNARATLIKPPGPAHDLMVDILRKINVRGFVFTIVPLEWNTGKYISGNGQSIKEIYRGHSYTFPSTKSDSEINLSASFEQELIREGFAVDRYNSGDGTFNGSSAYTKANLVCVLPYHCDVGLDGDVGACESKVICADKTEKYR